MDFLLPHWRWQNETFPDGVDNLEREGRAIYEFAGRNFEGSDER